MISGRLRSISGRLRSRLAILLLLAYCGLLFFHGLNSGDLYRNETLRAILAREMFESGDWIVPTLHGRPLFTKPPGMYWAIAFCGLVFGEVNEWVARLPSALAATAVVFLFYGTFSREFGRRAGLLAALLTPLSIFWLERVPSAEIDMLQVAWVSGAILLFARAAVPLPCGSRLNGIPIAALLCVAGGTLTKWTAPAFFYATILPYLWWRGQLRALWSWQHLAGVTLAVGLVAAWVAAAVWQTSWDAVYQTVRAEAVHHLAPGQGRHAFPWLDMLAHPLKILAANLPWSLFALWSLRPEFWSGHERTRAWLFLLHCWIWPNVVLWSLASEHSLRHSAPLFPAFTAIATLVVLRIVARAQASAGPLGGKLLARFRYALGVFLVFWFSLKAMHVHIVIPHRSAQRDIRAKGERLACLVPRGATLYVFRIKDDGLLFYFGGQTLRLSSPAELPAGSGDAYCILTAEEWARWEHSAPASSVAEMRDAQGDEVVLVRVASHAGKE